MPLCQVHVYIRHLETIYLLLDYLLFVAYSSGITDQINYTVSWIMISPLSALIEYGQNYLELLFIKSRILKCFRNFVVV